MQYQYITNDLIEIPKVVNQNGTPKLECQVTCVAGIVGDTHNFYKNDFLTFFIDVNLTIPQIQAELALLCTDYVAQTYPNT